MNHWKKSLFTAAALVAALPLALGQSAPVATRAARGADAPAASNAPVSADRAYLGVYPGTESDGGGVKLEQVIDGSPAEKAGLQAGDVITALGDRTIGSDEELREAIASHQSGEKVRVTFLRDGEKRRTSARLGKAPSESDVGGGESGMVT
jgi:S1-C subfamily serine protease